MKYFTKKQKQILKDNQFEIIRNNIAYCFDNTDAIYTQIYDGKLFVTKIVKKKVNKEVFNNFKSFSQRYCFME